MSMASRRTIVGALAIAIAAGLVSWGWLGASAESLAPPSEETRELSTTPAETQPTEPFAGSLAREVPDRLSYIVDRVTGDPLREVAVELLELKPGQAEPVVVVTGPAGGFMPPEAAEYQVRSRDDPRRFALTAAALDPATETTVRVATLGSIVLECDTDRPISECELLLIAEEQLDPELAERLIAGEDRAWQQFTQVHEPQLHRVIRSPVLAKGQLVAWTDLPTDSRYRVFARHEAVQRLIPMHVDWSGAHEEGNMLPMRMDSRCPVTDWLEVSAATPVEVTMSCLTPARLEIVTAQLGSAPISMYVRRLVRVQARAEGSANFGIWTNVGNRQTECGTENIVFAPIVPGVHRISGWVDLGGRLKLLCDEFEVLPNETRLWRAEGPGGPYSMIVEVAFDPSDVKDVRWAILPTRKQPHAFQGASMPGCRLVLEGLPAASGRLQVVVRDLGGELHSWLEKFDVGEDQTVRVEFD